MFRIGPRSDSRVDPCGCIGPSGALGDQKMSQQYERAPIASVVIPVHNAASVIAEQLEALCAQVDIDVADFEVITVLNRCSDSTEDVIRRFTDRLDITIVSADRLASAAYARNTGAVAARSGTVLFCDADDRVSATWARDLVEGLNAADFVGGRVLVDRDDLPEWAYRYFYSDKDAGLLVREGRIPYPISACMGIHTSALFAVNGFDETFTGASGEETDLAIRLLRAGFRVGFVDGAVLHYRPRIRFRELSRQQRARACSNSRLSLREGVEITRPTVTGQIYRTARRLGRRVLLERTVHPLALASDVVVGAARHAAAKWASTATEPLYDTDPEVLDFVVELGTPLIGGLAFRTSRSTVGSDSRSNETQRTTVALLNHLLTPGGVVIDINAQLGLITVAAAHQVAPDGRVIALEADAARRQLLRSNLLRHGCKHVEVPDTGTDSSGSPRDLQGLLAREPDAVVVAQFGLSGSDPVGGTRRRLARELGASGWHTWAVEPESDGAVARVRLLERDRVDESSNVATAHAGFVVAVPADRRNDMASAIERVQSGTDLH